MWCSLSLSWWWWIKRGRSSQSGLAIQISILNIMVRTQEWYVPKNVRAFQLELVAWDLKTCFQLLCLQDYWLARDSATRITLLLLQQEIQKEQEGGSTKLSLPCATKTTGPIGYKDHMKTENTTPRTYGVFVRDKEKKIQDWQAPPRRPNFYFLIEFPSTNKWLMIISAKSTLCKTFAPRLKIPNKPASEVEQEGCSYPQEDQLGKLQSACWKKEPACEGAINDPSHKSQR